MPFVDYELVDNLVHHLRQDRLTLRLGEEVASVETYKHRSGDRVRISLKSGKRINAEKRSMPLGACAIPSSLICLPPASRRTNA